jgi:hypothetical protein
MWFQCTECIFASNSPKQSKQHVTETGHKVDEEKN